MFFLFEGGASKASIYRLVMHHIEIALHRIRISERDGAKEYTQHRICM